MSVSWAKQRSWKIEDLASEIGGEPFELWEGELIAMSPQGKWAGDVAARVYAIFLEFVRNQSGIYCCPDGQGFIIGREPDSLFSPDAALFRLRGKQPGPWHRFSPEVAVEVASPRNTRPELLTKRDRYFRGGSEQVWIIDPRTRTIEIHLADGRCLVARNQVVECEGIAHGIRLDPAYLFDQSPFADLDES